MFLGTINIVNRYTCGFEPDGMNNIAIYRGHPLGNPFKIGEAFVTRTKGKMIMDRDDVILAYDEYLQSRIRQHDGYIISALNRIGYKIIRGEDVNLICYCKPKACHGDVIKRIIEEKINEKHG